MLHFSKLAAATLAAASLMIGAAGAQTVLRSSDTHPDGYPTVEAVKYFGELVKERTGGRYAVEVYHSAQLGEEKDTIEQVRSGVIDLNRVSMAPFNGTVQGNHRSRRCPIIFRSEDHMHKVMDGADRRPDQGGLRAGRPGAAGLLRCRRALLLQQAEADQFGRRHGRA